MPYAISNPLNVIKNPNYRNRYVIVTELSDKYGDIIVVPVEIDMNGKHNRIVSIYGKEQYDGNTNPDIKGYMEQNKENVVYDIDNDIQKKSRPLDAPIALRGNSSSDTISQSNDNVKSDNVSIKYSMQENQNNAVDSQGRNLSEEQREYFKDSKVRDESGRLLVVYHGSNNAFDNFSTEYFNKNETMGDYVGEGFFFAKNKNTALKYGDNVKSVYLDIKKPLIINTEQDGINYRNSFDGMYQPTTEEEILLREESRLFK